MSNSYEDDPLTPEVVTPEQREDQELEYHGLSRARVALAAGRLVRELEWWGNLPFVSDESKEGMLVEAQLPHSDVVTDEQYAAQIEETRTDGATLHEYTLGIALYEEASLAAQHPSQPPEASWFGV